MADLLSRLRLLVTPPDAESDAELLGQFVAARDGPAFAALVRRHGPMVLAVCRRVLRHQQDAEDAFQATFLVLAQRATAVKPRSLLGNWLYGVAYRTALAARRMALARRAREAKAAALRAEASADEGCGMSELREALDRELAALPASYRAAVVACDLEGLTRHEAAARLGWSEGTLSSRLARGRALLAQRLSRYGLAIPAAGLTAVAGPAAVARGLSGPTIQLGLLVAAGGAAVPAPVAGLMESAMGTMLLTKFKVLAAVAVVGCAFAATTAAGWRADAAGAADPPKALEVAKRAVNPDKERIAELERERERLLKELAELKERLRNLEAQADKAKRLFEMEADLKTLREGQLRTAERANRAPGSKGIPDPNPPAPPKGNSLSPPEFPRGEPSPAPKGAAPQDQSGPKSPERPPAADVKSSAESPKAIVKVYSVGDLVGDEKDGEALVKVVRATVEPQSWRADAGVGYLPGRKVLVVYQTDRVQKQVAELLALLQKQGSQQSPSPPKR